MALLYADEDFSYISSWCKVPLCPVPNMKHVHGITLNGKQNAENITPGAIEKSVREIEPEN